jgi:hypothetical protein
VSEEVVDKEFARRRQPSELIKRLPSASFLPDSGDAVVGGLLPCGHPRCNRVVDAAKGWCSEHKPTRRRRIAGFGGQTVDLDVLRADQQRRRDDLHDDFVRLSAEVVDVERRIAATDVRRYSTFTGGQVDLDVVLSNARQRRDQLKADLAKAEADLAQTERRIGAFDASN